MHMKRVSAFVAALLALAAALGGCTPQAQPSYSGGGSADAGSATAGPASVAGSAAPQGSAAEQTTSSKAAGRFDTYRWVEGDVLSDLDGNDYELDIPDGASNVHVCSEFSEGLVTATWTTSEYDEDWGESYGEQDHLGIFDADGNLVATLDDALASYYEQGSVTIYSADPFVDGVSLVTFWMTNDSDSDVYIAIDTAGNVLYQLADMPAQDPTTAAYAFDNGVVHLGNNTTVDTANNVVLDASSWDDAAYVVGDNLAMEGDDLVDFSGNPVSFKQEVVDAAALDFIPQDVGYLPLGENVFGISFVEESPHEESFSTRVWYGVYNYATKTWLIKPNKPQRIEQGNSSYYTDITLGAVENGVFCVSGTDMETAAGGDPVTGVGLMATDGTWVLEPVDAEDDDVCYYGDGMWRLKLSEADADSDNLLVDTSAYADSGEVYTKAIDWAPTTDRYWWMEQGAGRLQTSLRFSWESFD